MTKPARRALVGAALLCALAASPAARAATADGLRAILAYVPATATAPRKSIVDFTDLGVATALTGKRGFEAVMALIRRIAVPTLGEYMGLAEEWPKKVGFALDDVQALASAGDPPHTVHVYRLAPSVKLDALKKVWSGQGYAETSVGALTLWGRGKAGQLDIAARDPGNPFGGALGRSSFVLPALPYLAEAFQPDTLAAAAEARGRGGLAARADIAALLAVLDRGGGQLLQAALLPEPAATLSSAEGLAPYSAFLLADVEHGARAETVMMLALADCAAAGEVEGALKARWARQAHALAMMAPAWRSRAEDGHCVVVGTIAAPRPAGSRSIDNAGYRSLLHGLFARDLTALEMRAPR